MGILLLLRHNLSLLKSSSQWKKYLTSLQIAQFVIDLGVVYFGSESYLPSYLPKFLPSIYSI